MKTLTTLALLAIMPLATLRTAELSKPNILVILADDLGATKNLAATMPEKVAEVKALLGKLITDGRGTPGALQKNDVEVKRYPSEANERPKKKEPPNK